MLRKLRIELEQYFDADGYVAYDLLVDGKRLQIDNPDFSEARARVNRVLQNVMQVGLHNVEGLEINFIE